MDKIKDKLVEVIEILKSKHTKCLTIACDAIDDDNYNLRINDAIFLQGQITMAKEVIKWII